MSGPEPPPTEARFTIGLLSDIFEKSKLCCFPRYSRLCGPPQAPSIVMPGETSQKWSSFCGVVFYMALHVLRNMYS